MYDHLFGIVIEKHPTRLVLRANGVGYLLHISLNTFEELPSQKHEALVYCYLHVREDQLTLFGFAKLEERDVFTKLIGVSGIGPMTALRILSGDSINNLISAIKDGNVNSLSKIKGIGKKTAERIILELCKSMKDISFVQQYSASKQSTVEQDAVAALVTLGYSSKDAEKVIRQINQSNSGLAVDALIREALQVL